MRPENPLMARKPHGLTAMLPAWLTAASNRRRVCLAGMTILVAGVALGVTAFTAGPYLVDRYTIAGGGGTSIGGPYVVSGTIGQADTGWAKGGPYTLAGGFWPGAPRAVDIPVDPSLLAWWKLDETSGDIVYDSAATNDGVTYGGPAWQPSGGHIGGALKLDGVNDYVQLPIGPMIASLTDSTFATWVNWSEVGTWIRIFDFGSGTNAYMFLTPRTDTGVMCFGITNAGNTAEDRATAPQVLPTGWHHVAVTIDAASHTHLLYLDGQVVATKTAARYTPSSLGTTTQNWLGWSQWQGSIYFNGLLDDFRIYNRVLSATEVGQLAGRATGR